MVFRGSFFLLALYAPGMLLAAQTPAANMQQTNATAPLRPSPPSTVVQPSLEILKQALGAVNLEKWKASNAIRDEANTNLHSVQRDVESTLPSLLTAADSAPDSVAKTLPVFRNIDALYDVMLRLDAAGRLAAPKDQISALDQALASVSDARRALGDQLQSSAEAQETRVGRLQAALKATPPPQPPPEPVACTPPPPKKKKSTSSAKPKPASPQASPTPSH